MAFLSGPGLCCRTLCRESHAPLQRASGRGACDIARCAASAAFPTHASLMGRQSLGAARMRSKGEPSAQAPENVSTPTHLP